MGTKHYDNAVAAIADAELEHRKFAHRCEDTATKIFDALEHAGTPTGHARFVDMGDHDGPTGTFEAKRCHVQPNGEIRGRLQVKLGPTPEHLEWYPVEISVRSGANAHREVKVGKGAYLNLSQEGDGIAKAILDEAVAAARAKLVTG